MKSRKKSFTFVLKFFHPYFKTSFQVFSVCLQRCINSVLILTPSSQLASNLHDRMQLQVASTSAGSVSGIYSNKLTCKALIRSNKNGNHIYSSLCSKQDRFSFGHGLRNLQIFTLCIYLISSKDVLGPRYATYAAAIDILVLDPLPPRERRIIPASEVQSVLVSSRTPWAGRLRHILLGEVFSVSRI